MKVLLIVSFALASTGAFAQDLSMCLGSGYSEKCCKQSFAKYGAFGQAHGDTKQARLAGLEACKAKEAKR